MDSDDNFEEEFKNVPKNHSPFIHHAMSEMPDLSTFISYPYTYPHLFPIKIKPRKCLTYRALVRVCRRRDSNSHALLHWFLRTAPLIVFIGFIERHLPEINHAKTDYIMKRLYSINKCNSIRLLCVL